VTDHQDLIERYRNYGGTFRADEPLYADVCRDLANYPQLVELLAAHALDAQQPNLLFAAAHYLVLGGADHDFTEGADAFVDLVMRHTGQINEILTNRRTQTNEVARCSVLALMLRDAHELTNEPLAWIDLGASGGLNLNIDHFRIDYGQHGATGPADSPVQLTCEVRGGQPWISPEHAPIAWRIGVDREPVDIADEAEARWLQACLWPSQHERQSRLAAAIDVATANPRQVIAADAVDGLRQALAAAPDNATVVVTTTWVWYYLPPATRDQVLTLMAEHNSPVLWCSLEGVGVVEALADQQAIDVRASVAGRVVFDGGALASAALLADVHPHGAWIDWRH